MAAVRSTRPIAGGAAAATAPPDATAAECPRPGRFSSTLSCLPSICGQHRRRKFNEEVDPARKRETKLRNGKRCTASAAPLMMCLESACPVLSGAALAVRQRAHTQAEPPNPHEPGSAQAARRPTKARRSGSTTPNREAQPRRDSPDPQGLGSRDGKKIKHHTRPNFHQSQSEIFFKDAAAAHRNMDGGSTRPARHLILIQAHDGPKVTVARAR